MTPELISIYALGAVFIAATIWPVNMGVLAFVGAFLVGTLGARVNATEVITGFTGGLFLTLVGITYLFAIALTNGTIDWLVRLAVRAVRGRIGGFRGSCLDRRDAHCVWRGQSGCGGDRRSVALGFAARQASNR
jgi:hypothetical protein